MARPFYSSKDVLTGMPPHPAYPDRPLMWLTSGDQWWFRRTTNSLIPKSGKINAPGDPIVRYVICAIKHSEERGGGFDWAMWQEIEIKNKQGTAAVVSTDVSVPPSFLENEDLLEKSFQVVTLAFNEVYENPQWISDYEHPVEIRIIEHISSDQKKDG